MGVCGCRPAGTVVLPLDGGSKMQAPPADRERIQVSHITGGRNGGHGSVDSSTSAAGDANDLFSVLPLRHAQTEMIPDVKRDLSGSILEDTSSILELRNKITLVEQEVTELQKQVEELGKMMGKKHRRSSAEREVNPGLAGETIEVRTNSTALFALDTVSHGEKDRGGGVAPPLEAAKVSAAVAAQTVDGSITPSHEVEACSLDPRQNTAAPAPESVQPSKSGELRYSSLRFDALSWLEEDTHGMYLLISNQNGGTFSTVLSHEPVHDAVAFIRPSKYVFVPKYKYGKSTVLLGKVNQIGKHGYYQGWLAFLKEAQILQGHFILLPALIEKREEFPLLHKRFRMFGLSQNYVQELHVYDTPIDLYYVDTIGVTPYTFKDLEDSIRRFCDVPTAQFLAKIRAAGGAAMALPSVR